MLECHGCQVSGTSRHAEFHDVSRREVKGLALKFQRTFGLWAGVQAFEG